MRAGIGTRAYTSVRPSRTRTGQKSIDINKVKQWSLKKHELTSLTRRSFKRDTSLQKRRKSLTYEKAENKFMSFAHYVYDNFIEGKHHRVIAEKLEKVARGEIKRLILTCNDILSQSLQVT